MKHIKSTEQSFEPASHEDPADPGVLKKVLLSYKDDIRGTIQMVNWAKLLPKKSFKTHAHVDMMELFIILEGEAAATVDGVTLQLQKGDVLVIDPKEQHFLKNLTSAPVYFLALGIVP